MPNESSFTESDDTSGLRWRINPDTSRTYHNPTRASITIPLVPEHQWTGPGDRVWSAGGHAIGAGSTMHFGDIDGSISNTNPFPNGVPARNHYYGGRSTGDAPFSGRSSRNFTQRATRPSSYGGKGGSSFSSARNFVFVNGRPMQDDMTPQQRADLEQGLREGAQGFAEGMRDFQRAFGGARDSRGGNRGGASSNGPDPSQAEGDCSVM